MIEEFLSPLDLSPDRIVYLYFSNKWLQSSISRAAAGSFGPRLILETASGVFLPSPKRHVASVTSAVVKNGDGNKQTVIYNFDASPDFSYLPADAKLIWTGKRSDIISYDRQPVEHPANHEAITYNRGPSGKGPIF